MKRLLVFLFVISFGVCHAAVIVTSGSGSAVTTIDRMAAFTSINARNLDLSNYSEDLLDITVDDLSYLSSGCFNDGRTTGYHYALGGNQSYVTIKTSDAVDMSALEFLIGTGNPISTANVIWETYNDNSLTGSGIFVTTKGSVVGWVDNAAGFDELHVGAYGYAYTSFGQNQAIALDDLKVQLVPEPMTIALLGLGSLAIPRRKK